MGIPEQTCEKRIYSTVGELPTTRCFMLLCRLLVRSMQAEQAALRQRVADLEATLAAQRRNKLEAISMD